MKKGKRLLCGALALLLVLSLTAVGTVQRAYATKSEEEQAAEEQKKAEEAAQRQAEMDELERKKQEKKETTKSTKKLPMTAKMKRAMAVYIAMVLIMTAGASTVFAADDPLTVINNLSTFIFGLIRAIGMILLGFGIVQVGLSLKSHDPSQRANGFLTLAGGVIITFAKEILNLITG